jgi:hypothetical protein
MAITGNGGRPIGLPKTGGRKKNTPNRATLTLKQQLDAMGCDPLLEIARMGMNKKKSDEFRLRCFSEIAPYVYPKRKPVDISIEQPTVTNVITNLDSPLGGSDVGDQHNSQP